MRRLSVFDCFKAIIQHLRNSGVPLPRRQFACSKKWITKGVEVALFARKRTWRICKSLPSNAVHLKYRKRAHDALRFAWRSYEDHLASQTLLRELPRLDLNKRYGPGGLHPRISRSLAPSLCRIVNLSIYTSILYSGWGSVIIPSILKKSDKEFASNYRPINFTPAVFQVPKRLLKGNPMEAGRGWVHHFPVATEIPIFIILRSKQISWWMISVLHCLLFVQPFWLCKKSINPIHIFIRQMRFNAMYSFYALRRLLAVR